MNVKRILNHKRRHTSKYTFNIFLEYLSRGINRLEGDPAAPLVIALWCRSGCHRSVGCSIIVERLLQASGLEGYTHHLCEGAWRQNERCLTARETCGKCFDCLPFASWYMIDTAQTEHGFALDVGRPDA